MALEQRTGYKPNHKEFGEFILSEQARRPAIEAAQHIAEIARARAPRGEGPGPHMADQYKVNENPAPVVLAGNPRAGAEVFNEDINATRNEFGNKRTKAHRTLGKAGAEVGEMRGQPG